MVLSNFYILKMKTPNIFYFVASVLGMLFINACNADKLQLINPNELTPETFFRDETQVQQAVNAVYINLQSQGLFQRTIYYAMDNMSHEQYMNCCAELDKLQYTYFTFNTTHIAIESYWKSCYLGINKANFVTDNIDAINRIPDARLSPVRKDKFIGEARYLRALYYFLLVTRFGDIPLITRLPVNETGIPKSSVSKVWEQIEADLTYAAEKCLSRIDEDKGRATSGAAWALLGKAHLFQANASGAQADYEAAKEALLEVYNSPAYSLESRYLNNFEEETEHGPESIFEVEFNAALNHDDMWSSDAEGIGYNECTFRGREYGLMDWYNVYPSDDLLDEFEPGDPRYRYCFYSTGDLYNNGNDTIKEICCEQRAGWRKYQNYYKQESEYTYSGINMKVIRLADVILMLAETENELGNINEAIAYLNQVRRRADVQMPEYPTAEYPCLNQADIRKAVEHERKVELCGEQIRFNDLVRWRRLAAFMIDEALPSAPELIRLYSEFDPEIHYLWPIPQIEINMNTALTEADQNPGY